MTEQPVSRGLYLATDKAAEDFFEDDIETLREYARAEHAAREAAEADRTLANTAIREAIAELTARRETIERVLAYCARVQKAPPAEYPSAASDMAEYIADLIADSQLPAGQETPSNAHDHD